MSQETIISGKIRDMIKKEFPQLRLTRHQSGYAKGLHGGIMKLGETGWPDRVGYDDKGRFVGIEVKVPGNTTNKKRLEEQQQRIDDINQAGGVGIMTDSVQDCREQLKGRLA